MKSGCFFLVPLQESSMICMITLGFKCPFNRSNKYWRVKGLTELGIVTHNELSFLCIQREVWLFEVVSCSWIKENPMNQFDDMFTLRSHSAVANASRQNVEWMTCELFHIVMKIIILPDLKFYVRHSSRS